MMKHIVYLRPDGGVSVVVPAPERIAELAWLSENERLAAIRSEVVPPNATNVSYCDAKDIPTDRTFREAWEPGASGVKVNMAKARTVHRTKIRAARQVKFTELDADWMKATATGDSVAATAAETQRQTLRDLPQDPAIDAARTPAELKAAWPGVLD